MLLVTLLLAFPAAAPQDVAVDAYARALVDTARFARGDGLATLEAWLRLLREQPAHPLSEATLLFLAQAIESTDDPRGVAAGVSELDPGAGFDPAARRVLQALVGQVQVAFGDQGPGADVFPDYLTHFSVLGPVGEPTHAFALETPSPLYADPGFEREHPGYLGPVRWIDFERAPGQRWVSPYRQVRDSGGEGWLAARFDVPDGGPAWIEIETNSPSGEGSVAFTGVVPGYALALNAAPPVLVHALDRGRPALRREPVVLRAGRNELLVRSSLARSARIRLAIRILGPDGLPYPGVAETVAAAPLGREVEAQAPREFPGGSVAFLEGLAARGPDAEALLGMLLASDGQDPQALVHLGAALAVAPERVDLRARLALAISRADYLPNVWSRTRARELAEAVLEIDPGHHGMSLFVAETLAAEDREEEAIAILERLADTYPEAPYAPLALSGLQRAMGLDVHAETALFEARRRVPTMPGILFAVAEHFERVGLARRSIEVLEEATQVAGRAPDLLARMAQKRARIGDAEQALALLREAAQRDEESTTALLEQLFRMRRFDEARAILTERRERFPTSVQDARLLADLAALEGDREAELLHLSQVLELEPSRRDARERVRDAGELELASAFFDAHVLDANPTLDAYDGSRSRDSVVSVLDHALVYVFDDGAVETLTQNIFHVRDLEGCEELGTMKLPGEVVSIATLDGTTRERAEPVLVGDEYVMPALRPGDFVEAVHRTFGAPRIDRRASSGGWFFASVERPFETSRWVVSLPQALELRLAQGNLAGIAHEVQEGDGRTVHAFQASARARVLLEPGSPPLHWFLPWAEFGSDESFDSIAAFLRAEARWYTRVTPEIEAAARSATTAATGQAQEARALYDFVNGHLDQRGWSPESATQALLAREGNPTFLYLALLRARGIEAELVWSRGLSPREDDEPEPRFLDASRWRRQPLVAVRPADGAQTWCELHMSLRLLPYGVLSGAASQASALFTSQARTGRTPAIELGDRPGFAFEGTFTLDSGGAATVEGEALPLAGLAYGLKEQIRNMPDAQRQLAMRSTAARLIPGFELESFDFPGLDSHDDPVRVAARGRVATFLTRSAGALEARLPMLPLDLGADFAGEGRRRLPFFLSTPIVTRASVRLALPADLALVAPPATFERACAGGVYRLAVRPDGDGWLVEREAEIDAFHVSAEEYREFVDFCAAVDEAERVRLRFERK